MRSISDNKLSMNLSPKSVNEEPEEDDCVSKCLVKRQHESNDFVLPDIVFDDVISSATALVRESEGNVVPE